MRHSWAIRTTHQTRGNQNRLEIERWFETPNHSRMLNVMLTFLIVKEKSILTNGIVSWFCRFPFWIPASTFKWLGDCTCCAIISVVLSFSFQFLFYFRLYELLWCAVILFWIMWSHTICEWTIWKMCLETDKIRLKKNKETKTTGCVRLFLRRNIIGNNNKRRHVVCMLHTRHNSL